MKYDDLEFHYNNIKNNQEQFLNKFKTEYQEEFLNNFK